MYEEEKFWEIANLIEERKEFIPKDTFRKARRIIEQAESIIVCQEIRCLHGLSQAEPDYNRALRALKKIVNNSSFQILEK